MKCDFPIKTAELQSKYQKCTGRRHADYPLTKIKKKTQNCGFRARLKLEADFDDKLLKIRMNTLFCVYFPVNIQLMRFGHQIGTFLISKVCQNKIYLKM